MCFLRILTFKTACKWFHFSLAALPLVHGCLFNQKQKIKVNTSYSSLEEILFGFPQGFIVGPLFSVYFFFTFFLLWTYLKKKKYSGENLDDFIKSWQKDLIKLFQYFSDNQMKTCYDKSHLPVRYKNFVAMNVSSFEIKKNWMGKIAWKKCKKLFKKLNYYLNDFIKK